jgi:DNA replication protein DnaC
LPALSAIKPPGKASRFCIGAFPACSTTWRLPGWHRRAFARLARTRLLILDDWAMIRLTAEQRRDLMEVIDDRHDRAATLLASQIPVSGWFDQIGDATYADALLDRVVHNAHRIELRGESMRKRILANTEEGTATPEPAT